MLLSRVGATPLTAVFFETTGPCGDLFGGSVRRFRVGEGLLFSSPVVAFPRLGN